MIAEFIGLLTIIIAIWTWRSDHRRWMKGLGIAALGHGDCAGHSWAGSRCLHFLPPAVSSAHAALGQTFFCIAVAIALFTGRDWVEEVPQTAEDSHHPTLLTLTLLSIFILYVQLFLGAMFRHHGMSWWPHVLDAPLVAIVLTWTAIRALTQYSEIQAVRRPAVMIIVAADRRSCASDFWLYHPRRLGTRRGAARIADGALDCGPCCGGRTAAGDHGYSDDSGLAAHPVEGQGTRAKRQTLSSLRTI